MRAAFMISCFHKTPGSEVTRFELATGCPWKGRDILLGQLVYVHDLKQEKNQPNAKPAIFEGYRLDTGPQFKGVYLILDYKSAKVKVQDTTFQPVFPLKNCSFLRVTQCCLCSRRLRQLWPSLGD